MADQWDTYITRAQGEATPQPEPFNPFTSLLARLFGSMGGQRGGQAGGIEPNKQGMYTPSMMPMPVGPPTPINYGAMRSLLNSGVLRTGNVPAPVQVPEVPLDAPPPAPDPRQRGPLLSFLFGGGR